MAIIASRASNMLQQRMSRGQRRNAFLAHHLVVWLLGLSRGYRYRQETGFPPPIEMMVLPPGTAIISNCY